jgi:mono/diheme cytochrome c family protein
MGLIREASIRIMPREEKVRRRLWIWAAGFFILFFLPGWALGKDPKPPKKTPELLNAGKKLFGANCVPCHGEKGDGKGPVGMALTPHPSDFAEPLRNWPNTKGKPERIFEVISKGIPNSAMVAWTQFPEKERWGLVYYVMSFATQKKK